MEEHAVLIVDDEAVVVTELVESFRDEGHLAYACTVAAEALALLQAHAEIVVLVSDIRMPECDGPTLLRRALESRSEREALEAIFITGHAIGDDAEILARIGGAVLIRKPFRLDQLFASFERCRASAVARRRAARAAS